MIGIILGVVVLAIAGAVAFALKSKGSRSSGEFLAADAAPAAPARPAARATPSPVAPARVEPDPDPEPVLVEPVAEPDPVVVAADDVPNLDRLVFSDPTPAEPVEPPAADEPGPTEVATPAAADEPAPAPVADDRPEPMVRARLVPTAPSAPVDEPVASGAEDDDDDDQAVLSRFKSPGARVASIPIQPVGETRTPVAPEPAVVEPPVALDELVGEEPVDADPIAEPEILIAAAETDLAEAGSTVEVEPALAVDVEPEVAIEPEPEPEPERVVVLDEVPAETPAADAEADEALPVLTGDAAMNPVLEDPIVLTDEPALPLAQLQPEPELDPVDHVLKALISRAKEKQVGIAEVAAELVEQANLEDRDIDEVLADLVVRADDDTVDPSERLEELTLFNDSVPRRPGQLTDFDRLDKNARKKVIIRVLCLLVAMQEDNRLKPSEPRSEAETRHWPLARAVWPVPVADSDDAEDGDGDKKLPGRRLARTSTKR